MSLKAALESRGNFRDVPGGNLLDYGNFRDVPGGNLVSGEGERGGPGFSYSHSIVEGGFDEISSATRLTPGT